MLRFGTFMGVFAVVWGSVCLAGAKAEISVGCTSQSVKVVPPDWLCPLLVRRMQAAYPGTSVRQVALPVQADLVLHLLSGAGFSARLDWAGAVPGEPLAGVLRGKAMGPDEVAPLLDALISGTPRPRTPN